MNCSVFHSLITLSQQASLTVQPTDCCHCQLLSTTHKIYKFLDNGLEIRGIFLDISKAFDKV